MSKSFREDLTGQRFGRLTVIEFVPNDETHSYWKCRCDCGNISIVAGHRLKNDSTKSCGCLAKKHASEMCRLRSKHNMSNTRLFQIWAGMKCRCYNLNNKFYKNYGGRGITVCKEWKNDFMAFCNWAMNNGYDDSLTIDRIDVNGNYKPNNCRWISRKEQSRNRRSNVFVEYKGEKMTIAEASDKLGIDRRTFHHRYAKGDRGEQLFRPVKNK